VNSDTVFRDGFPEEFESTVRRVSSLFGDPLYKSRSGDEVALVSNTTIKLPDRIYVAEPPSELLLSLDAVEEGVARCLLARHHDGFVRQRQIADLVRLSEPWSVPYVLALLGEYVLEIHQSLVETLVPALEDDEPTKHVYSQLLRANPKWWSLIQNRVVSYWAAYHRFKYAMERTEVGRRIPDAYPAARVARSLGNVDEVPRLIKPLR